MNTSGVLDCVSVAEWADCSSPVRVRSILTRAAAVYSARVRGLCTVIVSVSTRLCHVGTSASVGCRWCALWKSALNCCSFASG